MAYVVSYSTPTITNIDGRKHVTTTITETGGGAADEWQLSVPSVITITSLVAKLTVAGGATTIDPELGNVASFVADETGPSTVTPAAAVRNPTNEHMTCPGGILRGRSKPNGTAGTVVTTITYAEGHI